METRAIASLAYNQYAAHNYAWLYFKLSNQNFEYSIPLIKKRTILSIVIGKEPRKRLKSELFPAQAYTCAHRSNKKRKHSWLSLQSWFL